MCAVWKFPLLEPRWTVQMPKGAEILHVHSQRPGKTLTEDILAIWASVDPAEPSEPRTFLTVMTGEEFPDDGRKYIGTAHLYGGSIVAHVFEKP